MQMRAICIFFALLVLAASGSNGARILGLFPFNAKSHSIMTNAIVVELLNRGHQLDVITAFPLPPSTPNYTAIEITPGFDYANLIATEFDMQSDFDFHDVSFWTNKEMFRLVGVSTTEYALQHPNIKELLYGENKHHYDLILIEQFYQDAFLMFGQKFKAPIVSISTFGWNTYFDYMLGSFGAWSHFPHELLAVPEVMTFWQRSQNVYYCLLDKYARYYVYMPQQQKLADKYFAHLKGPHPSLTELSRQIALIIQNVHTPMMSVKPNVPGVVDVGGLHITSPKPLPQDIQNFLDNAQHGVIYFSFGTQVPISVMPVDQLTAFLQVFNEFSKVRILLKWESDIVENLPKNVLPKKWLPQNDILAHPNVRLFITHGGLLGSQEAVHYGVPMLGIPFYGDQHQNTYKAALAGHALKLEFKNVTVESLSWALTELMYNPVYAMKAKLNSRIFRDRPQSAMDRAVYWIEYVIRFGGANHLQSAGGDLQWYSYFLLDIMAAVAFAVMLVVFVVSFAVRRIIYVSQKVVKCNQVNQSKKF